MLSLNEQKIIEDLGHIYNRFCWYVLGDGPAKDQDAAEFASVIHSAQARIMAQAAARSHPGKYRLMGLDFEGSRIQAEIDLENWSKDA